MDICGHHVFHAVLLRFELTVPTSYTHSQNMTSRQPDSPDSPDSREQVMAYLSRRTNA